ncbi:Satratoxin biosynthesis SC1 cluster protein 4 [Metarhizium anisopliae]
MRPRTQSAKENLAACIAMIVITTLAIIARFGIRMHRGPKPSGADWLCLASIPFFYAYCGIIMNFILNTSQYGAFEYDQRLGLLELQNLTKAVYATEILFGIIITVVKLSILWLYYGLFFKTSSSSKIWVVKGFAIACIVWFLIAESIVIFQCHPIHLLWDSLGASPRCFKSSALLLGYEMTNLFLDVSILCIPIPVVLKLKLATSRQIAVLGIFMLGSFAIWNQSGSLFLFSEVMMWSTLQLGLAITCSCLPTLNPIFTGVIKSFVYLGSWTASLWSHSKSQGTSTRQKMPDHHAMNNEYLIPPLPTFTGASTSQHNISGDLFDGSPSKVDKQSRVIFNAC